MWKDKSGKFQTEAAFVSFEDRVVLIHKLNGKKIPIPIDKLSDRDVEYVYRRCGLAVSSDFPEQFIFKGFDWLCFVRNAGVNDKKAAGLARQFVRKECDQDWLESMDRQKLLSTVDISGNDAILLVQAVTKRRLERLEIMGKSKLLESIGNKKKPESTGHVGEILPQPPAPQARTASQPHIASILPAPPILASQTRNSTVEKPQAFQPQRSIRDIPALQPQNSLTSVKIPAEPVFREFNSLNMVPIPNYPFMAQQQTTTTQYMMRKLSLDEAGSQPSLAGRSMPSVPSLPPTNPALFVPGVMAVKTAIPQMERPQFVAPINIGMSVPTQQTLGPVHANSPMPIFGTVQYACNPSSLPGSMVQPTQIPFGGGVKVSNSNQFYGLLPQQTGWPQTGLALGPNFSQQTGNPNLTQETAQFNFVQQSGSTNVFQPAVLRNATLALGKPTAKPPTAEDKYSALRQVDPKSPSLLVNNQDPHSTLQGLHFSPGSFPK